MDVLFVVSLLVFLAAAFGPRAGWYGTANGLWDVLGVIVLCAWLLRLLRILAF